MRVSSGFRASWAGYARGSQKKGVKVGDTMDVYLYKTDYPKRTHYPGMMVVVKVVSIEPFTPWPIPQHVSLLTLKNTNGRMASVAPIV